MGSKSRIVKDILPIIQQRIEDYDIKTYIEPFCLSKDTIVFTNGGIKTIKELNIGDSIIDDKGQYATVINKVKSKDVIGKYIQVKGNANFKATDNHIFYVNGKEVSVSELKVGDSLDIGHSNNENFKIIDMSNYITVTKYPQNGRSGKIIGENKIKLYHNAPITNRFIPISKELMHCYGLVVAKGDKSNITMHKQELDYLKEFVNNYKKILNIEESNKKYTIDDNKKSCQLSVPYKAIYEKLFFQAMNIGYGARNKNISFLFSVSKDMCLEAIKYMYIGNGSCSKKGKYRSLNYKTSSKTLAYQLQALLSLKFGIKPTISYGINKERQINGRTLKESDYYNISVTRDEDIEFLTKHKNREIEIHENTYGYKITNITSVEDEFYDITIDNDTHKFIINGGIVTHNCGGCNVIDHIECDNKYGYDNNEYLIEFWKQIQNGWNPLETVNMTKEFYTEVKDNKDSYPKHIVALCGLCATYNAKWFGGYAGIVHTKAGTVRNYYDEAVRNVLKQRNNIMDVVYDCKSYENISIEGALIYCDPPYEGTTKYKDDFDHKTYWDWVRKMSKKNIVLCSEYNAPEDFECIWTKELTTTLDKSSRSKAVEKLFIWNGGV